MYIIHKFSLINKDIINHPKLLMDEKAKSFRKDNWLNPPMLPRITLIIEINIINLLFI